MSLFSIFKVGNNPGKNGFSVSVSFNSPFLPTLFFFFFVPEFLWSYKEQGVYKTMRRIKTQRHNTIVWFCLISINFALFNSICLKILICFNYCDHDFFFSFCFGQETDNNSFFIFQFQNLVFFCKIFSNTGISSAATLWKNLSLQPTSQFENSLEIV